MLYLQVIFIYQVIHVVSQRQPHRPNLVPEKDQAKNLILQIQP